MHTKIQKVILYRKIGFIISDTLKNTSDSNLEWPIKLIQYKFIILYKFVLIHQAKSETKYIYYTLSHRKNKNTI